MYNEPNYRTDFLSYQNVIYIEGQLTIFSGSV